MNTKLKNLELTNNQNNDSGLFKATIPHQWREFIEWDKILFEQREAILYIENYMSASIIHVKDEIVFLCLENKLILVSPDGEEIRINLPKKVIKTNMN